MGRRAARSSLTPLSSGVSHRSGAVSCSSPTTPEQPARADTGSLAIETAIARHAGAETSLELRALEALRLDRLQLVVWDRALAGDLRAIDSALAIMAQRAKLLGLNAPAKQRVEVITEDTLDAAIRELEAEIAKKAP